MNWISSTASSFVTELFGTPLHQHVVPGVALQRSGILSKEQLLAFFEAGTKLICSSDVKSHLRLAAADGQDAGDVITELQKDLFASQGVDGDFGIAFLGKVNTVYGDDLDIMSKFYRFVAREELALDEAEMTPEDFQKKQMWLHHHSYQAQQQALMADAAGLPPDEQEKLFRERSASMNFMGLGPQHGVVTLSSTPPGCPGKSPSTTGTDFHQSPTKLKIHSS